MLSVDVGGGSEPGRRGGDGRRRGGHRDRRVTGATAATGTGSVTGSGRGGTGAVGGGGAGVEEAQRRSAAPWPPSLSSVAAGRGRRWGGRSDDRDLARDVGHAAQRGPTLPCRTVVRRGPRCRTSDTASRETRPGYPDHDRRRRTGAGRVTAGQTGDVTGRFAPSPTGPLHLGNLRTALVAWLLARSSVAPLPRPDGGPRPGHVVAASTRPASSPTSPRSASTGTATSSARANASTSTRGDRPPRRSGLTYDRASAPGGRSAESRHRAPHGTPAAPTPDVPRPDGGRRARASGRGRRSALRLRTDGRRGEFVDAPRRPVEGAVDDVVLRRNDGVPAYNLAVVVDDAAQGVTEVVRGDDLLSSTPRQIRCSGCSACPRPTTATSRSCSVPTATGSPSGTARSRSADLAAEPAGARRRARRAGRVARARAGPATGDAELVVDRFDLGVRAIAPRSSRSPTCNDPVVNAPDDLDRVLGVPGAIDDAVGRQDEVRPDLFVSAVLDAGVLRRPSSGPPSSSGSTPDPDDPVPGHEVSLAVDQPACSSQPCRTTSGARIWPQLQEVVAAHRLPRAARCVRHPLRASASRSRCGSTTTSAQVSASVRLERRLRRR